MEARGTMTIVPYYSNTSGVDQTGKLPQLMHPLARDAPGKPPGGAFDLVERLLFQDQEQGEVTALDTKQQPVGGLAGNFEELVHRLDRLAVDRDDDISLA